MKNDYFLELKRGKPIHYGNLTFKPITFGYICDELGLDVFDTMMVPFIVTKDFFYTEEQNNEDKDLFVDYILQDGNLLKALALSLQLFCDVENIYLNTNKNVIVLSLEDNETFTIDKNNFDDIAEIICLISGKQKIKVEKPPKNMSPRQRDVWEKLQEGRKREAKKNEVHMYDVLNVCEFGGGYRIPQSELDNMTLWQIMNCYKSRVGMKEYEDNLKICLVSGDSKPISGDKHWYQQLVIREPKKDS